MRSFRACLRWPLRTPEFVNFRHIRTLRKAQGNPTVMDIEAQLSVYSPEQKAAALDQIQQMSPAIGDNRLSSDGYQEALIRDALQLTNSPSELPGEFWKSVKTYLRTRQKRATMQNLDLLVSLFECAKEIPALSLRTSMLFEIGRQIYQQRVVRFDPDNELLFLDSLVANNRAAYALKLWNSRKHREDVNKSTEWEANGIFYLVNAGRISQAEHLMDGFKRSDKILPMKTFLPLINAYALQMRRGRGGTNARVALERHIRYLVRTSKLGGLRSEAIAILHALIIARQWGLASQLINVFSPEYLAETEQIAAIERALSLSVTSHITAEEELQFEGFFAAASSVVPPLGVSPVLMSALALSFAARSDSKNAIESVSFMTSKQLEIPRGFQIQLIKLCIKWNDISSLQHSALRPLLSDPKNLARLLRRREHRVASELVNALSEADMPLVPEVAFRLLEHRLVTLNGNEKVSRYGQFPESQSYIWYMCAMKKLSILPQKLVTTTPDVETLVYICQALVQQEPDFDTAVKKIFELLSSLPAASPAQAVIVQSTLRKLQIGKRLSLRPPRFKPTQKAITPEGLISWSTVAKPFLQKTETMNSHRT